MTQWIMCLLLISAKSSAIPKVVPKGGPTCQTIEYRHHDIQKVLACIEALSKSCETDQPACGRAMSLKNTLVQLLEQPQHLGIKFWRQEEECKAFGALQKVMEKPLFLGNPGVQEWNLRMSRVCGGQSALARALGRYCRNEATPIELAALKRRHASIDLPGAKRALCYQNFAAGESVEATADLKATTQQFVSGIQNPQGKPFLLDFENDPKAYPRLLGFLEKVDGVLYPTARADGKEPGYHELLTLPLLYQRVRVPVRSCSRATTSEVVSKAPARVVRVLSYQCSPHNRFRLALTGFPETLQKQLEGLPDPGPNENWFNGTVVGFRTTGVVTELIVAVDRPLD